MRLVYRLTLFSLCVPALAGVGLAQPPREGPREGQSSAAVKDRIITRMMKFDTNKDGKLSKEEITDERLLRLFDRADTNKDGIVSKEELEALTTKMAAEESDNGRRRGGFGPPGGPGGPPGGPGGFGPPRPGQILPGFLQEQLKLSEKQKKELEELQKEVDGRLAKLLTAEQKKQLEEMRRFGGGPRGRGPGGPPPGGPDGPPPGGPGGPPR